MINTMMERYIYDVTRRLPENERGDVKSELEANILDMLPEEPTDEDVRKALEGLGSPAKLADSYRQNPRCLISPNMYDEYVSALKWVLPLVGTICLVIGLVAGLGKAMSENVMWTGWVGTLASNGISICLSGLMQALFWTTFGFAVADRAGGKSTQRWTVDKLPDEVPRGRGAIPLSDGIVDLALTAVFTAVGVMILSGRIPVVFSLSSLGARTVTLFNAQAVSGCVPAVIIAGAIGACAAVMKMVCRRWNAPVCCAVIAGNIAGLGAVMYILARPGLWSDSFTAFIAENGARFGEANMLRVLAEEGMRPLSMAIGVIAAIIMAACVATAVIKTVRAR